MKYARIADGRVAEIIDLPEEGPPIEERFHPSIVAACVALTDEQAAEVKEGFAYADGAFTAPEAPSAPALPGRTLKSDVWRRATDAEAEAMDAMLNAAPVKMRRLWADSTILEHDSAEWSAIRDPLVAAFGEARAAELLAPSPGA